MHKHIYLGYPNTSETVEKYEEVGELIELTQSTGGVGADFSNPARLKMRLDRLRRHGYSDNEIATEEATIQNDMKRRPMEYNLTFRMETTDVVPIIYKVQLTDADIEQRLKIIELLKCNYGRLKSAKIVSGGKRKKYSKTKKVRRVRLSRRN